ncbi:MAG: Nitrogenase molybdenum-iron protein alpha chain [Firmicutes bacterium]|nr:Nitrogenase molybdenum-iron protein alpha chain [Bacillota bacterium]
MSLYKYLPPPSDRMGVLWALASIKGACVLEYGPAGTTHYGIESYGKLNMDLDASLFTTDIDEDEVIMGDSGRLGNTLLELDRRNEFSHIFVVASSVSSIIGTDIFAICQEVQPNCRARLHCFTGGGLKGSYSLGVKEVLTTLARDVVAPVPDGARDMGYYNILGSNADCYNYASDIAEVERMMEGCFGLKRHAVFTAQSSMEAITSASRSGYNLVLRAEGLPAAKLLKERFGQEYYYGVPYGYQGTQNWLRGVANKFGLVVNAPYVEREAKRQKDHLLRWRFSRRAGAPLTAALAGNYDLVVNLARFLGQELSIKPVAAFVNHGRGSEPVLEDPAEEGLVKFALSEGEKEAQLNATRPDIVLADGLLLKMHQPGRVRLQVSHPNLSQILLTSHLPLVGFNGAGYLLEKIMNSLQ